MKNHSFVNGFITHIYYFVIQNINTIINFFIILLFFLSCSSKEKVDKDKFEKVDTTFKEEKDFSFFVIGDWGYNGCSEQMKVKHAMNKFASENKLDFILSVGDNFQYDGVASADDSLWKINFENVYLDSFLLVPWFVALGNHDYYGNENAQIEYAKKNKSWILPSKYYSFIFKIGNKNSTRFIIIDTYDLMSKFNIYKSAKLMQIDPQYSWIIRTLKESKEKWIIVVGHHPVFSGSLHDGDVKEINTLIKPLLNKYKVDFYLCGHDHDFEHAREKGKHTDYVVAGTGAFVDPANYNERTLFTISVSGFTYFTISEHKASFRFISNEEKLIYEYTKMK